MGRLHSNGCIRRYGHNIFNKGDFVDATITIDIVTGKRFEVYYKLDTVILLKGRSELLVRLDDHIHINGELIHIFPRNVAQMTLQRQTDQ